MGHFQNSSVAIVLDFIRLIYSMEYFLFRTLIFPSTKIPLELGSSGLIWCMRKEDSPGVAYSNIALIGHSSQCNSKIDGDSLGNCFR